MSSLPPELDSLIPPKKDNKEIRTVTSLQRHICPRCGGKGEWNPRKQLLCCPYCSYEFEPIYSLEDDAYGYPENSTILEHPLLETLEKLGKHANNPEQRIRFVRCRNCNAKLERTDNKIQRNCDFCGSPELVEYEESGEWIQPESVLPLKIEKETAYRILRSWIKQRFWAPNNLKSRSLVDSLQGIYLPYWTFDAQTQCPWEAESGTYYWTTERYRDASGNYRTKRVRKIRWSPAQGHVSHFFDDVSVSASKGAIKDLLQEIEPFPSEQLVPYATDYLSGWEVEAYEIGLAPSAQKGETIMVEQLRSLCARQIPGDTYRNLRIQPSFSAQTFKHILVPVWIVAYQYQGKTWQCLINGVTGTLAGKHPISWIKVTCAILGGLLLTVAIFILFCFSFAQN